MTDNLEVLYEDNHLLVVNKPAGVLSQSDITGDSSILDAGKAYLKEKYNKRGNVFLGCVHRLDRPVSGIIVMARTSKALSRLNQQFRSKEVKKTYQALTDHHPKPEQGQLVHYLVKDAKLNLVKTVNKGVPGSKEAVLMYRLVEKLIEGYLLEINPLTGRPHQIRVQLASLGCPIKGDLKYGSQTKKKDGNLALHAYQISFRHPVSHSWLTLTCPPAPHWYF